MPKNAKYFLIIFLAILLLTACASTVSGDNNPYSQIQTSLSTTADLQQPPPATNAAPDKSNSPESAELTSIIPTPERPTPAPTQQITFQVSEEQYKVPTDEFGILFRLCQGPIPGDRIPLFRMIPTTEEVVTLARQHLAECLGVPLERVQIASVEEVEFFEPITNCSPPGNCPDQAFQGPRLGYRIVLMAEEILYEYHWQGKWLVFWQTIASKQ